MAEPLFKSNLDINVKKNLESSWIQDYEQQGFLGPIRLIDEELAKKAAKYVCKEVARSKLLSFIKRRISLISAYRLFGNSADTLLAMRNRHLDNQMLALITAIPLLKHISSVLLSADPVLWRTQLFLQSSKALTGHRLHRDNYAGLVENLSDQISCQVAFSASTHENCMIVLPGTHMQNDEEVKERLGLESIPKPADDAYGTSQYRSQSELPENLITRVIMQPGECIFFHPQLIHGSITRLTAQGLGNQLEPRFRQAIALRLASESNQLLPKAFIQTVPREDRAISL